MECGIWVRGRWKKGAGLEQRQQVVVSEQHDSRRRLELQARHSGAQAAQGLRNVQSPAGTRTPVPRLLPTKGQRQVPGLTAMGVPPGGARRPPCNQHRRRRRRHDRRDDCIHRLPRPDPPRPAPNYGNAGTHLARLEGAPFGTARMVSSPIPPNPRPPFSRPRSLRPAPGCCNPASRIGYRLWMDDSGALSDPTHRASNKSVNMNKPKLTRRPLPLRSRNHFAPTSRLSAAA